MLKFNVVNMFFEFRAFCFFRPGGAIISRIRKCPELTIPVQKVWKEVSDVCLVSACKRFVTENNVNFMLSSSQRGSGVSFSEKIHKNCDDFRCYFFDELVLNNPIQ